MKLFDFQIIGSEWLASRRHALLADEMGVGKTVQAIRACDKVRAKEILVVCPAVARTNWCREFKKWTTRSDAFHVRAVSYEFVTANSSGIPETDVLIIDEVHYAKSLEAKRSQAIFGASGLVHRSNRVWALSGTPAPNHAAEMWILLYAFGATTLSYGQFVQRFCVTVSTGFGNGYKIVGTKKEAIPELRELLKRIMLRRLKKDVLKDLPPLLYSVTTVEPGHVSRADFTDQDRGKLVGEIKQMQLKLDSSQDEVAVLEALAESVSTLRRYTGLQKALPAAEMIAGEIEVGLLDKVVVFAIHKAVIEILLRELSKVTECVTITGSTPDSIRQLRIDQFQNDPHCRVFIGNIQAAGTALTLTASHQVVFVEMDWVPGNNAQAAQRCHRIGQDKTVNVRFISLDNPMDERITQVLNRKTSELSQIFA